MKDVLLSSIWLFTTMSFLLGILYVGIGLNLGTLPFLQSFCIWVGLGVMSFVLYKLNVK